MFNFFPNDKSNHYKMAQKLIFLANEAKCRHCPKWAFYLDYL